MSGPARPMRMDLRTWAACGFGLGFSPFAPGTVAAAGVAILWGLGRPDGIVFQTVLVVALALSGVWLCGHAEKTFGRDAGAIVWDEFAGFAIAAWMLPSDWTWVVLSFALFRGFDIMKPWPVGASQRLPGGWGVVVDDLLAGIYANLAARALMLVVR